MKEDKSFKEFSQHIGQEAERYKVIGQAKLSHPFFLRLLLGLLLVMVVIGIAWHYFFASFRLSQALKYDEKQESFATFVEKLPKLETDADFYWDEEVFNDLKWSYDGAQGASLEEVVKLYGAPMDAQEQNRADGARGLTLIWTDGQGEVTLRFREFEEGFHLENKSYFLQTAFRFPVLTEGEAVHNWTQEEFISLTVGNVTDGKGGASADDIVAEYGKPSEVSSFGYDDGGTLTLTYKRLGGKLNSYVQLNFRRQKDGKYLLYSKTSQF